MNSSKLILLVVLSWVVACAEAGQPGPAGGADAGFGPKADAMQLDQEVNCADGVDDDGDGFRDCADPDCSSVPPCVPETNCSNQIDDNANGLTDCRDPSCDGAGFCEFNQETSCDDGNDNDGDGNTDCADPDCAQGAACIPETNCTNGVDDEGDGNTDCADVDCDGVGTCEFGSEASCTDGLDNDGDGSSDCNDPDCSILAACAITCPTGTTASSATAAGLPTMIPDFGNIQSIANLTAPGSIVSAMVRVDLPHEFTGDLRLVLISPDNTETELSVGNGGFGAGYIDTWFDDTATMSVSAGLPPFTGSFKPDEPLNKLVGRQAAGNWRLAISDQALFWTGSLESFTVYTCSCSCADPGCTAGFCQPESDCNNGVDDDVDGAIDCADSDCASTTICAAESDCTDGVDNDGDGLTDCADPGCAATCESVETTCNDGVDNDGNGSTDCADPACAFACALPACAGGEKAYQFTADSLPLALADVATSTSTIDVASTGTLTRVGVRVSLTHTYDSDLDISLRSPGGTAIDLSSGNGGAEDNYTNTVFTDAAGTLITNGSAPFTGSFRPEQALSGLNGQSVNGTWSLEIADTASGDTGSLSVFEVAACVTP